MKIFDIGTPLKIIELEDELESSRPSKLTYDESIDFRISYSKLIHKNDGTVDNSENVRILGNLPLTVKSIDQRYIFDRFGNIINVFSERLAMSGYICDNCFHKIKINDVGSCSEFVKLKCYSVLFKFHASPFDIPYLDHFLMGGLQLRNPPLKPNLKKEFIPPAAIFLASGTNHPLCTEDFVELVKDGGFSGFEFTEIEM
ncbi:MAG: hypothetical protein RL367_64 [Pseudomonadota bacterium]